MTEQRHEPDEMADEQSRREAEARQKLADGKSSTGAPAADDDLEKEAAYSTEAEQGAAQPRPGT